MEQELKLKKRGVSGVVVFFLIILFLAVGLVAGWYVGKENLITIGTDKEEKEEKTEKESTETKETEELKTGECQNCKEGNKYIFTENSNIGLTVEISSDMNSATIRANNTELGSAYGLNLSSLGDNQYITEVKVDGFNKKIMQVHIGGFGQAVGAENILYVLEDGTIEYTPVFSELKENWSKENLNKLFKTHKAIDKIDNVSYVTGATVTSGTTGHYTTVAVRKDGSFYDLGEMINR